MKNDIYNQDKKIVDLISAVVEGAETRLEEYLEEKYKIYHKDFSSAVKHARDVARKKGYEVPDEVWDQKVALGPKKPSGGKTNSYNLELEKGGKTQRKRLAMQVYNMDNKGFELNMYIESSEEELDENKVMKLAKDFEKRAKKSGYSSRNQERERMSTLATAKKQGLSPSDMQKLDKEIVKIINKMDESVEVLEEGVNDPAIFKAVFLAGGPGSGKSFIVGKTALTSLGMRVVNSDPAFEKALKSAGLEMTPDDIFSPAGQDARTKAKKVTSKQQSLYVRGRLGLVIDGTGKDYEKIKKQKDQLEKLGYETAMIFVNTNLDTAISRDAARSRTLGAKEVEKMWSGVQNNIGKFQSAFKSRMFVVDNSDGADFNRDVMRVYRAVSAWAKKDPTSRAAKKWISGQKQKRGIKEELIMSEGKRELTTTQKTIMSIKEKSKKKALNAEKKALNAMHCNEDIMESVISDMQDIVSKKQAKKIKGTLVDLFTASMVTQIYDKVNDANKAKMEKLPLEKLVDIAYKLMKKEEVETLEEASIQMVAKDIEKYAKKLGKKHMDYYDFMTAADFMKDNQKSALVKYVNNLDTEPRELILMKVKNMLGQKTTEKMFKVKFFEEKCPKCDGKGCEHCNDKGYHEELSAKQKKIDLNKNGKVDGDDLAKLRSKKEEFKLCDGCKTPKECMKEQACQAGPTDESFDVEKLIESSDKKDAKEMADLVRELEPKIKDKELKAQVYDLAMEKYKNKTRAKKIANFV